MKPIINKQIAGSRQPIATPHSSFLIFSFYLLLFTFTAPVAAQNALTQAQQGDAAFSQKNYTAAVENYRNALSAGQTSPELLYNLGNAYFRLDSLAQAILYYERTLRLDPSFDDARENLQLANSRTVDRISPLPSFFLADWVHTLASRISLPAWRIITLLALALLAAAIVAFLLSHSLHRRKLAFSVAVLFTVLTVASFLLLLAAVHHANDHSQAVVMQQSVAVKSTPEEVSPDKLILHEGTKVTISQTLSGYHEIILADGTKGWCDTNSVERI